MGTCEGSVSSGVRREADPSVAVPCAKRACERSAWVPPQDDTHAGRVGKHLDAKRLAPLVDRLGNARLQALAFVAIGLYLLDALARRRGDVRPQRVVERPGHRLRILLRVIKALEQACRVGVWRVLQDG